MAFRDTGLPNSPVVIQKFINIPRGLDVLVNGTYDNVTKQITFGTFYN